MNGTFLSVKSWLLTHQPTLWGDVALVTVFSGLAMMVVWEHS